LVLVARKPEPLEKIEHRSSALIVDNAAHPSYLYRLSALPGVVNHVGEITAIIVGVSP